MKNIEIVEFEEKFHNDFKNLSYEWLKKYDLLEPVDEKILNDPVDTILNKGGFIYFAKYNGEIAGTSSLIRIDDSTFELAKLAVTEKYQGLKIGRLLIEKCIDTAKQKKVKRVILYTNRKLISAIELYKRNGFNETPLNSTKYAEADMKMELFL